MPYTPSVQDRSGEILAQGITQGFSSLTQGVEKYYKKREEKQILDSTVTSLMSRAASSPKLAQFLGVDMSDEKAVQAGIKAAGGGDAMAGARALRQSLQQFGEFERQEKERENDNATFNTGITRIGNKQDPFVPGANYSPRVAKALSDITTNQALAEERQALAEERRRVPAPKPPTIEKIEETDRNGNPVTVTYRVDANGNRVEIGKQLTGNPGMRVAQGGARLQPIPGSSRDPQTQGSPAQIAAQRAATDALTENRQFVKATEIKQERAAKFIKAAESRKAELEFTLGLIDKAAGLSLGGAGGAFDKFTTFTGGATDVLQDTIEAIQANTALDKMAELKSLSPTGATGFGNQSDKEGGLMRDYRGKLKVGANEKQTQSVLKDMKAHIQRQLAGYNPKSALDFSATDQALLDENGIVFKNR